MADTDRIVFPEEVEEVKEAAKSEVSVEAGDTNSVEETPPTVTPRNMIVTPANCPAGYQMGSDGVCREVFN